MGRKLRLSHKKNDERKKYHCVATLSLQVSIPLKDVSVLPVSISLSVLERDVPTELTVSLPLAHFSALPVFGLDALRTRLTALRLLPTGWTDASLGSEELTFCQISHHSSAVTPTVSLTLKIATDLSWALFSIVRESRRTVALH